MTFQHSNSYFYIDFIYYKSEWVDFLKKKPILNSVQFECKTSMGRRKNSENSLRSPSYFKKNMYTYLSQSCFIEIWTAYRSKWDPVKHWLSFFCLTRWQNKRQILERMVIFMSQAVRNVSFTIIINFFSPVQPPECKQRKTVGFIFRILFLQ